MIGTDRKEARPAAPLTNLVSLTTRDRDLPREALDPLPTGALGPVRFSPETGWALGPDEQPGGEEPLSLVLVDRSDWVTPLVCEQGIARVFVGVGSEGSHLVVARTNDPEGRLRLLQGDLRHVEHYVVVERAGAVLRRPEFRIAVIRTQRELLAGAHCTRTLWAGSRRAANPIEFLDRLGERMRGETDDPLAGYWVDLEEQLRRMPEDFSHCELRVDQETEVLRAGAEPGTELERLVPRDLDRGTPARAA